MNKEDIMVGQVWVWETTPNDFFTIKTINNTSEIITWIKNGDYSREYEVLTVDGLINTFEKGYAKPIESMTPLKKLKKIKL